MVEKGDNLYSKGTEDNKLESSGTGSALKKSLLISINKAGDFCIGGLL